MILEFLKAYWGYCSQCRQPAFVGEFKLAGWKHTFCLCSSCVRRIADGVEGEEKETIDRLADEQQKITTRP